MSSRLLASSHLPGTFSMFTSASREESRLARVSVPRHPIRFPWEMSLIYLAALDLSCGMWGLLVAAHMIFSCSMWTLSHSMWDLVSQPGIEPGSPALGAQSLSHWTTREVPMSLMYIGDGEELHFLFLKFTCGWQRLGVWLWVPHTLPDVHEFLSSISTAQMSLCSQLCQHFSTKLTASFLPPWQKHVLSTMEAVTAPARILRQGFIAVVPSASHSSWMERPVKVAGLSMQLTWGSKGSSPPPRLLSDSRFAYDSYWSKGSVSSLG